MSNPRFSIFIPVWNDVRWLPGAIESVLAQSYPHWELVIGDNASTADLGSVVQRYADARITYHRWPTHTDVFENFNRTMWLCGFEWLQPLCADDRLSANCLERMATELGQVCAKSGRIAAVVTACRRVDADGRSSERAYYGSRPVAELSAGVYAARTWFGTTLGRGSPPWNVGSVALSREVVTEMGSFFRPEIGLTADMELVLRIAAYGHVLYLDEPLLNYTVRGSSDRSARAAENRRRGDPLTPEAAAFLSALRIHEMRRPVDAQERAAVHAAVARSYLMRAMCHRYLPGGMGRYGALLDVLRAARMSPRIFLSPGSSARAALALLAPVSAILGVRKVLGLST